MLDSNSVEGMPGGWFIVGGTSVAAPALAGIVNSAGGLASSAAVEQTAIYANLGLSAVFRDIVSGYCGPYAGTSARRGWDFCTGLGSPYGKTGK